MDQDESDFDDVAPTVKLVNAILLSMIKRPAQAFSIRPDGETSIVEFVIGGETIEEMTPPIRLHTHLIRRLSVMARLPIYGKDDGAIGGFGLMVGKARYDFEIEVRGHGLELTVYGRLLSDADVRGPYR